MIISDVITVAKLSELAGTASKDNNDAIVAYINMGLLELYTRFQLKTEEYVINLVENQTFYEMPSDFMIAVEAYGETEANKYDDTKRIPINDGDCPNDSIFFNDWNTAQVPGSQTGAAISIIYVAKPTPITVAQATDGVTQLELPDTLVDALLSYLGYRAHLGIRGGAQSENDAHWARFQRNCDIAIDRGVVMLPDVLSMKTRIKDRGFV